MRPTMINGTQNIVIFLDANVIIYTFKPQYQYIVDALEAENEELACSEMVRLEVMGFAGFEKADIKIVAKFFGDLTVFPISEEIIDIAIGIRQQKSIKSPDAIIAATAIATNQKLWTSNVKDFGWIKGLNWHNPVAMLE